MPCQSRPEDEHIDVRRVPAVIRSVVLEDNLGGSSPRDVSPVMLAMAAGPQSPLVGKTQAALHLHSQ